MEVAMITEGEMLQAYNPYSDLPFTYAIIVAGPGDLAAIQSGDTTLYHWLLGWLLYPRDTPSWMR
jgi:hypothetical protein